MEYLPDIPLINILKKLSFRELIDCSRVNRRWNQSIFDYFANQIVFRMACGYHQIPELPGIRCYRTVRIHEFGAIQLTPHNIRRLEELGQQAKTMQLISQDAEVDGENLIQILGLNSNPKEFSLHVWTLTCERTEESFRHAIQGMLPNVTNLSIDCRFAKMVCLLAAVAAQLDTLDVVIYPQFENSIYQCSFPNLHTITIRIVDVEGFFPTEGLVSFLLQLPALKKVTAHIHDLRLLPQLYRLKNLEELTISPTYLGTEIPASLIEINCLRNLRYLNIGAAELVFPNRAVVPSVTTLLLEQTIEPREVSLLFKMFPNVNHFGMPERSFSRPEILQLVTAWPALLELSLCIRSAYKQDVAPFCKLTRLRKLVLWNCSINKDYSGFEDILAMPTMRELKIQRAFRPIPFKRSVAPYPPEQGPQFGNPDRQCDVYYEGRYIERVVSQK